MPLKVTVPPTGAAGGVRLVIVGLITSNATSVRLAMEFTVTTTGPTPPGAFAGTLATIWVFVQLAIDVATAPLKLTVPGDVPKLEPVIVTCVPSGPNVGDSPETYGVVPIVSDTLSKVAVAKELVL